MYLICGFVVLVIFAIIVIFAFPQFSPIPYFPSNKKDIPLILQALRIRNNQTIIDLGAGDGLIIFEAAQQAYVQKKNTQFYAVEINPVLLAVLWVRKLLHPNRANIHILKKDMFSMDFPRSVLHVPCYTFYIYISPWFIDKTIANIKRQIKAFDVVSYYYRVKSLPEHTEELKEGVHKIYTYRTKSSHRA